MCDNFMDDFGDDFDEGGFHDDRLDDENLQDEHWDDPDDGTFDLDPDDLSDSEEPVEDESDEFTWKDAVILGGAMGWAYEEGYNDKKLKHLKKYNKK